MRTEKVELYFRQGSSDKVYHLQLENVQDRWSVQAQWGRRGSALQSDAKISNATYEEAKRIYDRVLREKTGKGYQIAEAAVNGNAAISVGLPPTKELSGHSPELLTPIDEPDALRLVEDISWWFQQKFDGRRLAVLKADGKYSGINKLGQIVPIPAESVRTRPSLLLAMYAAAPRIPMALLVLGAIYKQATPALLILGALAGVMQLLDAGIGLFQHDLRKWAGPLFFAVLQFFVVYLLH